MGYRAIKLVKRLLSICLEEPKVLLVILLVLIALISLIRWLLPLPFTVLAFFIILIVFANITTVKSVIVSTNKIMQHIDCSMAIIILDY